MALLSKMPPSGVSSVGTCARQPACVSAPPLARYVDTPLVPRALRRTRAAHASRRRPAACLAQRVQLQELFILVGHAHLERRARNLDAIVLRGDERLGGVLAAAVRPQLLRARKPGGGKGRQRNPRAEGSGTSTLRFARRLRQRKAAHAAAAPPRDARHAERTSAMMRDGQARARGPPARQPPASQPRLCPSVGLCLLRELLSEIVAAARPPQRRSG
jgi:hypothetical protein